MGKKNSRPGKAAAKINWVQFSEGKNTIKGITLSIGAGLRLALN